MPSCFDAIISVELTEAKRNAAGLDLVAADGLVTLRATVSFTLGLWRGLGLHALV